MKELSVSTARTAAVCQLSMLALSIRIYCVAKRDSQTLSNTVGVPKQETKTVCFDGLRKQTKKTKQQQQQTVVNVHLKTEKPQNIHNSYMCRLHADLLTHNTQTIPDEFYESYTISRILIQLVSWCFKPNQPQRIISGLREAFIKKERGRELRGERAESTNKAELRPEEQSEKAESYRENLWNENS